MVSYSEINLDTETSWSSRIFIEFMVSSITLRTVARLCSVVTVVR